jgi:molybdopterin/thiamine biosynthesis adenylyltransferase/rhodanese-related sulfurtransferase
MSSLSWGFSKPRFMLSPQEQIRYQRHLSLPEVGEAGQLRLKQARVLLVGVGGLGSPIALYLAAAGVGTLGLVDGDQVTLSNLQRQVLYSTAAVGQAKVEVAAERLQGLNPDVQLELHPESLGLHNGREILAGYDLVIDGSDNFATRYVLNDLCVQMGLPLIHGSIYRFEGQVARFHGSPCYRCLFPAPPPESVAPNCSQAGVLGVLPGLVGTLQALEALKYLLGHAEAPGHMTLVNTLPLVFRTLAIPADPACPACGEHPQPEVLAQAYGAQVPEVSPQTLRAWQQQGQSVTLLDVRSPEEYAHGHIASRHIPVDQLSGALDTLRGLGRLVVHCQSGVRSARAVALLQAAGLTEVFSLKGGLDAWQAFYHKENSIP